MTGGINNSLVERSWEQDTDLRFEEALLGSSQSHLVRDSNDRRWVMKCNRVEHQSYSIVNEILGSSFCRALNLPLPPFKLVDVPDSYFRDPITWSSTMDGRRKPKPGLRFLSRYMPDLTPTRCYDRLPVIWLSDVSNRDDCLGMFVFDVWADHRDVRQAVFVRGDQGLRATFIDNSHLFGGHARACDLCVQRVSATELIALDAATDKYRLGEWIEFLKERLPAVLQRTFEVLPQELHSVQTGDLIFHPRLSARLAHLGELVHSAVGRKSALAATFGSRLCDNARKHKEGSLLPLV